MEGGGPTDDTTYETRTKLFKVGCTCLGGSRESHLGPKFVVVTSVFVLVVDSNVTGCFVPIVDVLEYVVVSGEMDGDGEVPQDVEIFTISQVALQYAVKHQPKPSVTL